MTERWVAFTFNIICLIETCEVRRCTPHGCNELLRGVDSRPAAASHFFKWNWNVSQGRVNLLSAHWQKKCDGWEKNTAHLQSTEQSWIELESNIDTISPVGFRFPFVSIDSFKVPLVILQHWHISLQSAVSYWTHNAHIIIILSPHFCFHFRLLLLSPDKSDFLLTSLGRITTYEASIFNSLPLTLFYLRSSPAKLFLIFNMQVLTEDQSPSDESSQAEGEENQVQTDQVSTREIQSLDLPDFISENQLRHLTKNRAKVPQRRSPSFMRTSLVSTTLPMRNEW